MLHSNQWSSPIHRPWIPTVEGSIQTTAPAALPATFAHGLNTGVPRKKCIVRASSEGRFASCVVHFLLVFQDSVRFFWNLVFLDAIVVGWGFEVHDSVGCSFRTWGWRYWIIHIQLTYVESEHELTPLKMEVWKMMWHYSPLQSFSKEFDLRGYPPIGGFTCFYLFRQASISSATVASMHCMYQCMYMFTNKVGNAKKVSKANAWREIQSRYSTWLESHIQHLSPRRNIQNVINVCWVSCCFQ